MLQNIAFALFGIPSSEGDMSEVALENAHLEGYTSRQKERVMSVYEKLCEQSKLPILKPLYSFHYCYVFSIIFYTSFEKFQFQI